MKSKADIYSQFEFSTSGLIFYYFGRVILLLPFIFFYLKNKASSKDMLLTAFLLISIFSQVFVSVERLLNYLYIPFICIFVDMVTSKDSNFNLRKEFIVLTLFLNLLYVINVKIILDFNITHRAKYQAVFFPYHSIFDKQIVIERENFMRELWDRTD